jgi:hypothetical protein
VSTPITSASLPGSAINAPVPNMPGGGVNFPAPMTTQLNLTPFGATPLSVQNLLSSVQPGQAGQMGNQDFAKLILANADSKALSSGGTAPNTGGGESFISHVLDALNLGIYSTAGAASGGIDAKNKAMANHEGFLSAAGDTLMGTISGFGHGIAGAFGDSHPGDKTDWSQVLMQHGADAAMLKGDVKTMPDYSQNAANKFLNAQDGGNRPTDLTRAVTPSDIKNTAIANAIEGTGADMVLDPLNAFNIGGAIKKGMAGIKNLTGAGNDAARIADANNLENLLKDYKSPQANIGDINGAQNAGALPEGVSQIPNSQAIPTPTPNSLGAVSPEAIQKGIEEKGAGIAPDPALGTNTAPVIPPGVGETSDLNTAFKAGLQNALAGSSDPAKLLSGSRNVNPDFLTQAASNGEKAADPIAQAVNNAAKPVTPPPVAAPIAGTGDFARMADPAARDKLITRVLSRTLQGSDGPNWATNVLQQLHSSVGGMNGLEKTAAFLDRMSSRIPSLKQTNLTKLREALGKTLEADHEAHIATPKAMKAVDIVNAVSEGDSAATAAAAPVIHTAEGLKPDEQSIAQRIVQQYEDQVGGSGHFPGLKNPADYSERLAAGSTKKWSGPKQVNMFQSIASMVRKAQPGMPVVPVYSKSIKILRAVEAHFMDAGHVPYSAAQSAHSVPLRLTDVLHRINPGILAGHADYLTSILRSAFGPAGEMDNLEVSRLAPELKDAFDQAMQAAKAGAAMSEAPAVKKAVTAGEALIQNLMNSGKSDPRVTEGATLANKAAQDIARQAGGSDAAVNTTKDVLKSMYVNSDKFQLAVTKGHLSSMAAMSKGVLGPAVNNTREINGALRKIIGGPAIGSLATQIGPQANALGWSGSRIAGSYGLFGNGTQKLLDFLGVRFNPAYGNKDIRPALVQAIASARAISAHDASIYNNLFRSLGRDPEEIRTGMLIAQGHIAAVSGSASEKWAQAFLQHAENLLGSTSIRNLGLMSDTVAGRGQLLMTELNSAAARFGIPGKFTNAKDVVDAMGKTHDLSQGADWLKSWQMWDIKDPTKFMMQLSNTVNHATREAKMFDEMASRFGTIGKTSVDHPRLKGIYFPPDIADQIRTTIKQIADFKKPSSNFGRLADKVLSKYKTAATMYIPAHHVRAALGDIYLSWLAGNEDVSNYSAALRVMKSQIGRYKAFDTTQELTGTDAIANAMARAKGTTPVAGVKGSDVIFTMKNGMHITSDMIYTHMFQRGLLPTAKHIEDIPEEDALAKMMSPFNGHVHDFVNMAAETREHFIRVSHFIDTLKKNSGGSFEAAVEKASADVRKWHPDGTDLTDFERRTMRRIFPFYSWSRKALPLIFESLLMRPTKISAYPRLMYGASVATGAINPQQQTESDPFPTDALFPNWLEAKGIGPLFGNGISGYTSVTPNIPSMDILEQVGGLTSGNTSERANAWSSLLNPGVRVPEELLTGQTLGGSPIMSSKTGYGQYLLKQIPQVQQYAGISNVTSTDPNQQAGQLNVEKLLNYLAAAGISNDGQYQKQAMNDYMNNQRVQGGTGW